MEEITNQATRPTWPAVSLLIPFRMGYTFIFVCSAHGVQTFSRTEFRCLVLRDAHESWSRTEVFHASRFRLQTNYDHWTPAPAWDNRRVPGVKHMTALSQAAMNFDGVRVENSELELRLGFVDLVQSMFSVDKTCIRRHSCIILFRHLAFLYACQYVKDHADVVIAQMRGMSTFFTVN